jgi:hypothetical protein
MRITINIKKPAVISSPAIRFDFIMMAAHKRMKINERKIQTCGVQSNRKADRAELGPV